MRINEGKTKLGKVNVMAFTVVGYVCWRGERLVGWGLVGQLIR